MSRVFDKVCIICNSSFQTPVHNKMVCSTKCHNKYRVIWNREHRPSRKVRYGNCPVCGKQVELPPKVSSLCCSGKCRDISNKKRTTKYKMANAQQIKKRNKIFKVSPKRKQWEISHREQLLAYRKKYDIIHREELLEYKKNKYRTDLEYKLGVALRGYVRRAVVKKQLRTKKYIDYTIPELINRIESQFQPGMSWDNYGKWHIDHIRPLVSFNFFNADGSENVEEIKKAMALSNLQPLWARDNISKGGKYMTAMEV